MPRLQRIIRGIPGPGSGALPPPGPPGGGGGTGRFLWDWNDLEADNPTHPQPDAPGNQPGAPTTMAQWEAYFFSIIHRSKDSPANDFNQVLMELVNQGAQQNPSPGQVPQESWAFYGISIMVSGGEARGRIWLPTATSHTFAGNVGTPARFR